MNIAIEHKRPDLMQNIGSNLTESISDPNDIEKSSKFFEEHGQFDKAVELKIKAGQLDEAMALTEQHNVNLTDELA